MTALEGILEVIKMFFWSLLEGAKTILSMPIIRIPLIAVAIIVLVFIIGKIICRHIKKKALKNRRTPARP